MVNVVRKPCRRSAAASGYLFEHAPAEEEYHDNAEELYKILSLHGYCSTWRYALKKQAEDPTELQGAESFLLTQNKKDGPYTNDANVPQAPEISGVKQRASISKLSEFIVRKRRDPNIE
ncbi:MAG: hypothetical protein Q9170_002338 [Blastenia crenularia]